MAENDDVPMLFSASRHDVEMTPYRGGAATPTGVSSPPAAWAGAGPARSTWWGIRGMLRRRRTAVAPEKAAEVRGKEDDALTAGPRGLCGDPNCKACPPSLVRANKAAGHSQGPGSERKLHRMIYEDTRSWARYFSSVLDTHFPIRNPEDRVVQLWNRFFICSCIMAIFLDPLFFFVLKVNEVNKCISFDWSYAIGVVVFRSLNDFLYLLHMLLQFRLAYVDPESRVVGSGIFIEDPHKIARHYLRGYFALDVFNVLPLPQVLILSILPHSISVSGANNAKNLLRVTILVQYLPRIFRFVPLLAGQSATRFIYESAWINFMINLLMFMLAGHVIGSGWYLLGLQRVNQCLREACDSFSKRTPTQLEECMRFIDCGDGKSADRNKDRSWSNSMEASDCFQDAGKFNYGIYKSAVNLTTEGSFTRYIYSLFWGFQQISTLAGNQTPSYFVWEVMFTMFIIMLGLFLFALLIGSMQNFLLALVRRRLEMQIRRHDVERWMSHRYMPDDLRNHVREAERLNWSVTRGVNEDELIENLPDDLQRKIRRHLFKFLKKVRLFSLMDDQLLDSVCEKLRQNFYINGSDILSQGAPVDKIVFIVRGKMKIERADGSTSFLCEGDACGEELLAWYLDNSSINKNDGGRIRFQSQYLPSNRKVTCISNVEAFTLHAADLDDISSFFARFLRLPRVQGAIRYESSYWRDVMARQIQVAWRYRRKRLRRQQESRN